MLKYGKNITFDPSLLDRRNIDRQSVSLIPQGARVLEIGCATGFMGEYLIKGKKCKVTGIELGKEEAREARKKLTAVIEGDIEDPKILQQIKGEFDVVFASAIIEHLKDPWKALGQWKKFLIKDGFLLITTSNITHWSIRLRVLRGDFRYQEFGILDNTHLRFFTPETFKDLVRTSGYEIENFSIDPVGGGFPRISLFLSRFFPNVFAYQMLIVAKPL